MKGVSRSPLTKESFTDNPALRERAEEVERERNKRRGPIKVTTSDFSD